MNEVSIIGAVVIGVLAGWIAEQIMGREHGLITNLIVGVVGAFLGAFIANLLGFGFAGFYFIALNIENLPIRVLRILENRPGRDVAGIINMLAIRCKDRFAEFLLMLFVGFLDQHNAATARHMIQPNLARPQ